VTHAAVLISWSEVPTDLSALLKRPYVDFVDDDIPGGECIAKWVAPDQFECAQRCTIMGRAWPQPEYTSASSPALSGTRRPEGRAIHLCGAVGGRRDHGLTWTRS
jgi:hypothetical protein